MPTFYSPTVYFQRSSSSDDTRLDVDIISPTEGVIEASAAMIQFAWTRPCSEFRDSDIQVDWFTDGGLPDTHAIGKLNTIGENDNQRVYSADLDFPNGKDGRVRLTVLKDAAELATDDTITGPPAPRIIELQYNRRSTIPTPTVEIITPPTTTYYGTDYGIQFRWSAPISDFVWSATEAESDITLSEMGASIEGLAIADDEGAIWEGKLILSPNTSGNITITVKSRSVNFAQGMAPENATTATFAFDSRSGQRSRTVTGGTLVSSNTKTLASNTGVYNCVLEQVSDATYIYKVEQLMKTTMSSPRNFPDENKQAGAQLVRVTKSGGARTIIKSWDEVTTAARSLFIHNGSLHWIEGSHYAEQFNDETDTIVDRDENADRIRVKTFAWKNGMGRLYRYNGSMVEDLGQIARSAFINPDREEAKRDTHYGIHIGTASPIVELPAGAGGGLSLVAGYGDTRRITEINDPVSLIENWTEVVYGTRINPRIDFFHSNDRSAWNRIEGICTSLNLVVGFEREEFEVKPGTSLRGKLTANLSDSATSATLKDINFVSLTKVHPGNRRIALIDNEIVSFVQNGLNLTSLNRGQFGTQAVAHAANDRVDMIDYVFDYENGYIQQPIESIQWRLDDSISFSAIQLLDRDGDLIAQSPDPFPATLPLGILKLRTLYASHQTALAKHVADSYYARFGVQRLSVNLTLKYSPFLKNYQTVIVKVPTGRGILRACQVLDVSHDIENRQTTVLLATV